MAFFAAFPTTLYDIEKSRYSNYEVVTNVFFRVGIIKEALDKISAYSEYRITESDTPEILAEKIYNDPTAYWIILYANNMYDPQYDWPLNSRNFEKFIISKYGSVPNAQSTYHHYEKVIERFESFTNVKTVERYVVDYDKKADVDVPYDYYLGLPETQQVITYNFNDNNGYQRTMTETVYRNAVTNYDYEFQYNERNRFIKIINPIYYGQIVAEFNGLTDNRIFGNLRNIA